MANQLGFNQLLDFRETTEGFSTPEYVTLSHDDVEVCEAKGWPVQKAFRRSPKVQLTLPLQSSGIHSKEFSSVKTQVQETYGGKGIEVKNVWRVQNPAVYRKYLRNQDEYFHLYGKCKVMKLFHGTKLQNILSIVRENLDTRDGGSFGSRYGKGVNFSKTSFYASHYCDRYSSDKYLLLCDVLVANMVQVPEGAVRDKPPFLPNQHTLRYDTTTKNSTKLDVVVKFSENEFYPTHIIHITDTDGRNVQSRNTAVESRPTHVNFGREVQPNRTRRVENTGNRNIDSNAEEVGAVIVLCIGIMALLVCGKVLYDHSRRSRRL